MKVGKEGETVDKLKIGLIFGGRSWEHEVSVWSAESIRNNLNKKRYEIRDIFINKAGEFNVDLVRQVDVIFPIVHGIYGEDGRLQGLLEMLGKPYVGAGVLGSALGMDKEVQKRLLMQVGIKTAKYQVIKRLSDLETIKIRKFPVFVKPANGGSSVGTSKCKSKSKIRKALANAFQFDNKVLIEGAVEGREIEVSVLGNQNPIASVPGEIIPQGKHDFYDYEAKYVDEKGAKLEIPVKGLSKSKRKEIQKLAIKTFKTLECEGMARVDMFLLPNGQLVMNEINTLPGFTNISMYPKLWAASGLIFPKLLDKLIKLALDRKQERDKLKQSFDGVC
jgi:D-alanine-D-alanine ligase